MCGMCALINRQQHGLPSKRSSGVRNSKRCFFSSAEVLKMFHSTSGFKSNRHAQTLKRKVFCAQDHSRVCGISSSNPIAMDTSCAESRQFWLGRMLRRWSDVCLLSSRKTKMTGQDSGQNGTTNRRKPTHHMR